MKQAKTGNAFQQDQKLYQNEKVSEKKKIFEKKSMHCCRGTVSSFSQRVKIYILSSNSA